MHSRNCPRCEGSAERYARLVVGVRRLMADVHRTYHADEGLMHWWLCPREPCAPARELLDIQPNNRKAPDAPRSRP